MSVEATWPLVLVLACGAVPCARATAMTQDPDPRAAPPVEEEVAVTTASAEALKALMGSLDAALRSEDAKEIAAALAPLSLHDNPELAPAALDALKYRASKLDKKAAKALGDELETTSKNEIAALIADREAAVQEAAAHVLANFEGDKKVLRGLERAFKDKTIRRDKPRVVAALIRSFGRIRHGKVEDEVVAQLRKGSTKEVSRACVRYLGTLPTRDYRTVRMLCEMLDAPEPGSVDDASNPPADWWASAWETWNWTRRDVSWALKELTGEVFRPAEGEHASDSKKALQYVEAHRKELGLR